MNMKSIDRLLLGALALGVCALALRPFSPIAGADFAADSDEIAVCAIPTLVNELIASGNFAAEREELNDDFQQRQQELQDRLEDIQDRARGMEQDDPALGAMAEEFGEVRGELLAAQSEFGQASEAMTARHLAEAYELARASAEAVAEDLGFGFVFASGSPDEELNRSNAQQLLGQLSRRPVIRFPEAADITDDVRDDLGLD